MMSDGIGQLIIPEFADGLSEEEVDDTTNMLMILDQNDLKEEVNKSDIVTKGKDLKDKGKMLIDMSLHLPLVPTDFHASVQATETCQVDQLNLEKVPVTNEDLQVSEEDSVPTILPDKKKLRRKKEPAMVVRQSSRIKKDGVPIQVKAQQRVDQLNNITGFTQSGHVSDTMAADGASSGKIGGLKVLGLAPCKAPTSNPTRKFTKRVCTRLKKPSGMSESKSVAGSCGG